MAQASDNTVSTESHPALSIHEIICLILNFSDKKSLVSAACLCRAWYPLALDLIWKELHSIIPLLELFCSLRLMESENCWEFDLERQPQVDWENFQKHAQRVQTIYYNDVKDAYLRSTPKVSSSSILHLQSHLTSQQAVKGLLPNLRHVSWDIKSDTALAHLFPFIARPKVLHSLQILMGEGVSLPAFRSLLYFLGGLDLPNLRTVEFNPTFTEEDDIRILPTLGKCISRLQKIKKIKISTCLLTEALLADLAAIPSLQCLHATPTAPDQPALYALISQLSAAFSTLRVLRLTMFRWTESEDVRTFATFRPLLHCTSLRELQISDAHPIILLPGDIQAMGQAWQELKILHLAANIRGGGDGASLRWLTEFASAMPSLSALALNFTDFEDIPSLDALEVRMENLEMLAVGTSQLQTSQVQAVGEFLGGLCPPGTQILSCKTWESYFQQAFDTATADQQPVWQEVGVIVRLVHRAMAAGARLSKKAA